MQDAAGSNDGSLPVKDGSLTKPTDVLMLEGEDS